MKETILREGVEANTQETPAFTTKYFDNEKEETGNEILTLRFNPKNRENLDVIKYLLSEAKDATAIKYAIEIARNVIQGHLSEDSWIKICSGTRRKQILKRPTVLDK